MPTVDEILLDVAPELSSVAEARRLRVEDLAYAMTGDIYGDADLRNLAAALRAAHMLTLAESSSATGVVTSETVGPLSISYAAGGAMDLGSTAYGRQLEEMNRGYIFGPRTRVMS